MKNTILLIYILQSFFAFAQENTNTFSKESFNSDWKFARFG